MYIVEIIEPKNGTTIPHGQEHIRVVFQVKPKLWAGDSVLLYLDNELVAEATEVRPLTIPRPVRGLHTLQVKIIDSTRTPYPNAKSRPVQFYQYQPSVNFPNAKP